MNTIVFIERQTLIFQPSGHYFCSLFVIFALCHFDAKDLYSIIDRYWRGKEYHRGGRKDEKNRNIVGRRQS